MKAWPYPVVQAAIQAGLCRDSYHFCGIMKHYQLPADTDLRTVLTFLRVRKAAKEIEDDTDLVDAISMSMFEA